MERRERQSVSTIMIVLCSSFVSKFLVLPAALVLLFFHVFAGHPLPPLGQPLTTRTVFTSSETAAMVTRMALWKGEITANTGSQWCDTKHSQQQRQRSKRGNQTMLQCSQNINQFNQFADNEMCFNRTTNHNQTSGGKGEDGSIKDWESSEEEGRSTAGMWNSWHRGNST